MANIAPVVALTPGEPAGIGPDLTLAIAGRDLGMSLVVVADADMLAARARLLGIDVDIEPAGKDLRVHHPNRLLVHHVPLGRPVQCGHPDPRNAGYVIACLDEAVSACLSGRWQAMVTGPVHKAVINDGGVPFTGHTEYLARVTGAELPVMMLVAGQFRVALVTTHLPLSRVPAAITADRVAQTLEIIHRDLQSRFGIDVPRILVCGLNPHAGEGGHLGREEIDVIQPALDRASAQGINVRGPLPADTAFTRERLAEADIIVAMFHDQGLPVLKYAGFGRAVNVTLGLPIIRTSVDHGTALDIAGSGSADPGSLMEALALAAQMATAGAS